MNFQLALEADGIKFEEPNDNMFSFNSLLWGMSHL